MSAAAERLAHSPSHQEIKEQYKDSEYSLRPSFLLLRRPDLRFEKFEAPAALKGKQNGKVYSCSSWRGYA